MKNHWYHLSWIDGSTRLESVKITHNQSLRFHEEMDQVCAKRCETDEKFKNSHWVCLQTKKIKNGNISTANSSSFDRVERKTLKMLLVKENVNESYRFLLYISVRNRWQLNTIHSEGKFILYTISNFHSI